MVRVSYEDAGQVCTYFGWGLVQWECCCLGHVFGLLLVQFFVFFFWVFQCLGQSVWLLVMLVGVAIVGHGGFLVVALV